MASFLDIDPRQRWAISQYRCDTGNCSWPAVPTLVARHTCKDISPQLVLSKIPLNSSDDPPTYQIGVPGGPLLIFATRGVSSNTPMAIAPSEFYEYLGSIRRQSPFNVDLQLLNVTYVLARGSQTTNMSGANLVNLSSDFVATQCSLRICVQHIGAEKRDGQYAEVELPDTSNNQPWCQAIDLTQLNDTETAKLPGVTSRGGWALQPNYLEPKNQETSKTLPVYTISGKSWKSMQTFLRPIFSGRVQVGSAQLVFLPGIDGVESISSDPFSMELCQPAQIRMTISNVRSGILLKRLQRHSETAPTFLRVTLVPI
jgi:hypothetical protein